MMTHPFDPFFSGDTPHAEGRPGDQEPAAGPTDLARLIVLWERLRTESLRRVLEHWLTARGNAVIPTRARIDPARFAACLPHVWIFRLMPDGEFRCTLAGEAINSAWGRTIMNRTAREILGEDHEPVVNSRWRSVLGRPSIMHAVASRHRGRPEIEHLVLPVADAAGEAVQVLGVTAFAAEQPEPPICETRTEATFYPLDRTAGSGQASGPGHGAADDDAAGPATIARPAARPTLVPLFRSFRAPRGAAAWGVREYP